MSPTTGSGNGLVCPPARHRLPGTVELRTEDGMAVNDLGDPNEIHQLGLRGRRVR